MGNLASARELQIADGDPFLLCLIKLFKAADYKRFGDQDKLHVWLQSFKTLRPQLDWLTKDISACDCSDAESIQEFNFKGEENLKVDKVFSREKRSKYFIGRAETMSGVVLTIQQSKHNTRELNVSVGCFDFECNLVGFGEKFMLDPIAPVLLEEGQNN